MSVDKLSIPPSSNGKRISGTSPCLAGDDAARERVDAIYGLASTLSVAYLDAAERAGKSLLADLNPAILSSAFDAIALLAVDASRALEDGAQ